ncbi:hypothetical protein ACOTV5_02705 [Aliarcobacter butzleri]|uniref:ORC-CDC6 family AAA ATPase n=1 Tax=Aliarcobacter butzleri TaxID=28197 RepID=UPI00263E0C72|nr:hypothetical protein [Aliarcobacter butzleri]MDN5082616.1 hypothetical protein [Aliarcobacter butzleri]MDN5084770.1 hypothetical protein [Aliarcobacter butzleri]
MNNPFEITKAEHLDETLIVSYWAEVRDYYKELLVSPKPMYILGAKGTGKTHLIRYFSYDSQKIRAINKNENIIDIMKQDSFFSVNISLNDYSLSRFNRINKKEQDLWSEYFFYYINLIMIEEFLYTIKEIIKDTNVDESQIKCNELIEQHLYFDEYSINNCEELYLLFRKKHKSFDKAISKINMGMIEKLNEDLLLFDSRNNVFYDITYEIISKIESLSGLKVVYFIDEFENLDAEQQKYINTIIRHPKYVDKISIKVSGRLYSIKTEATFDASEKLLHGAEVEKKFIGYNLIKPNLDTQDINEKFCIELFNKRVNSNYSKEMLENFFETNNLMKNIEFIHEEASKERKYFKKLMSELLSLGLDIKLINKIIENLSVEKNALYEKINILEFYRKLKNKNYLELSNQIKNDSFSESKKYIGLIHHYKEDLIYQILVAYNKRIIYSGFKTIINLTKDNPRAFLQIQKSIYNNCLFHGFNMLSNNVISKEIQNLSIRESSNWFWENAVLDADNRIINAIYRLCNFFRLYRNFDKISEKKLISFAYNPVEIGLTLSKYIDDAINHSLLIRLDGRKSKDGKYILNQVRINPMLSPKWDLPITIGNSIPFDKSTIEALFKDEETEWDLFIRKITHEKTFQKNGENKQKNIFEFIHD